VSFRESEAIADNFDARRWNGESAPLKGGSIADNPANASRWLHLILIEIALNAGPVESDIYIWPSMRSVDVLMRWCWFAAIANRQ
jgi:hypothetical protein